MKRGLRAAALLAALLLLPLCAGCAGGHRSEEELTAWISEGLREEVVFQRSETAGELKTYRFSDPSRDFSFRVVSYTYRQDGRPVEDLLVYYEEDYLSSSAFLAARADLAERFSMQESLLLPGTAVLTLGKFSDIPGAAEYLCALDALCAFEETLPQRFLHCKTATVQFPLCAVEGPDFSVDPGKRLREDEVRALLEERYVRQMKRFGYTDDAVPKALWDSISPEE